MNPPTSLPPSRARPTSPAAADIEAAREIICEIRSEYSHRLCPDIVPARIIARHHSAEREELVAAKNKADEMEARCVSLCLHLPPETLGGQVQKWRDEYRAERAEASRVRAAGEELAKAAKDFCAKVDRGEARSVRSYALFSKALSHWQAGTK